MKNKKKNAEATEHQNVEEEKLLQDECGIESDEGIENKEVKKDDLIQNLTAKKDEYYLMLQRLAAEFDNYKKRTAKEKEALYQDSIKDVVSSFIPVLDTLEIALKNAQDGNDKGIKEGIELVTRQFTDVLKKLGVEEIISVGSAFDPNLHNAVMHIQDDSMEENIIVEQFRKGYIIKDRVIRHSMVKVAN